MEQTSNINLKQQEIQLSLRKSLPDMSNLLSFILNHSWVTLSNAVFWSREVTCALLSRSALWKLFFYMSNATVMQLRPFWKPSCLETGCDCIKDGNWFCLEWLVQRLYRILGVGR